MKELNGAVEEALADHMGTEELCRGEKENHINVF